MHCTEFLAGLQTALDERREPHTAAALAAHAAACSHCAEQLKDWVELLRATRELPSVEAPVGLASRVLAELGPARLHVQPSRARLWQYAVAASLLLIALPVGWMLRKENVAKRALLAERERPPTPAAAPFDLLGEAERLLSSSWTPGPRGAEAAGTGDGPRRTNWEHDLRESFEPVTRSTSAALDVLWQAVGPESEGTRS
jgi:hypothetical protein